MNRLTRVEGLSTLIKDGWKKKDTEKNYTSICYGCEDIAKCVNKCGFCKALDKLAAYENTELEPEEVKRLNASDASKEESSIKYYNEMRKYRDELREYKRLEEQGRLIKLPCRLGDTVYQINYDRTIENYKVVGFEIDERGKLYVRVLIERPAATLKLSYRKEDLYFSREEAEKALEEMK